MDYLELAPAEPLSLGFTSPDLVDRAWTVRWDRVGSDLDGLVLGALPAAVDFHTSGSTGPSQRWRRTRESLWLEAGLLAELLLPDRPEAVVSFTSPAHIYGALATVLMPARLRAPVWYRLSPYGAMPAVRRRRIVVVGTPWTFQLLLSHLDWVRSFDHVTVLHSSAMLPATALELLDEVGLGRAAVVEVLGSTEAGGIATRRWHGGDPPPWTLFSDVSVAGGAPAGGEDGGEVPLVVRSPRLAARPGAEPPAEWETGDFVRPLDERTFEFTGRRTRLVKVNGRRINLDEVEHALRSDLRCADLAVVPVADRVIGEHVDLLLVLRPDSSLAEVDLAAVRARLGVRPRRVHVVPHIDRSDTGKLRHLQTAAASEEVTA